MFSSQDFLYPDGTPMDAEDIALMVNDLVNKSKGVSVERGATLRYVQDVTLPYIPFQNDVIGGVDVHPFTVHTTTVPVRFGVFELIRNEAERVFSLGGEFKSVVLGYNIAYSLGREMTSTGGDGRCPTRLATFWGYIDILVSPVVDRIDFVYDDVISALKGL